MKILAVHGVGRHRKGGEWEDDWKGAISRSMRRVDSAAEFDVNFLNYDDIFAAHQIEASDIAEAMAVLGISGLIHGIDDLFSRGTNRRSRGPAHRSTDSVRWTAGMIVQWIENNELRAQTRGKLADAIGEHDPDIVLAHSLGSLIAYDTFMDPDSQGLMSNRFFVSFGSQIGHPAIRTQFSGRIEPVDCRHWYHLYNPEDDVFTEQLRLSADNFEQVDCFFDIEGFADHDATRYLSHLQMSNVVWSDFLERDDDRKSTARKVRHLVRHRWRATTRALLVGIDEYPNPDLRLEGCGNDAFLMSSMLQECGYDAKHIRMLLNARATADAIRDRIEWLLDDVRADDDRVFFFSGHGAQVSDYGVDETVDGLDECLVPWDFDWSRGNAVTDDWFHEIYSQLDYGSRFVAILDCCHSGGMSRAGVGRPRGLSPPDDIRHRTLKWDRRQNRWGPRLVGNSGHGVDARWFRRGAAGRRLGSAVDLRPRKKGDYDQGRKQFGHYGPYVPVLIQACQEDEFAYEYRHGNTAYGAFTFNLVEELRAGGSAKRPVKDVVASVARQLDRLGYPQRPNLFGPKQLLGRHLW